MLSVIFSGFRVVARNSARVRVYFASSRARTLSAADANAVSGGLSHASIVLLRFMSLLDNCVAQCYQEKGCHVVDGPESGETQIKTLISTNR